MEYIVIIWVLIFLWGLWSLIGVLNNDNDARWVTSLGTSWALFFVYSAIVVLIVVIKFIWTHLPGG